MGQGPEVSFLSACFSMEYRKSAFIDHRSSLTVTLQRSPLSTASDAHCCPSHPSPNSVILQAHRQKKNIIIFLLEVQLHRAENETPITDEANALLIINPDVAWILSFVRVCQAKQTAGREAVTKQDVRGALQAVHCLPAEHTAVLASSVQRCAG